VSRVVPAPYGVTLRGLLEVRKNDLALNFASPKKASERIRPQGGAVTSSRERMRIDQSRIGQRSTPFSSSRDWGRRSCTSGAWEPKESRKRCFDLSMHQCSLLHGEEHRPTLESGKRKDERNPYGHPERVRRLPEFLKYVFLGSLISFVREGGCPMGPGLGGGTWEGRKNNVSRDPLNVPFATRRAELGTRKKAGRFWEPL